MHRIAVVTTFSKEGYERYARRMIGTFDKLWPPSVHLYCYPDEKVQDPRSDRVHMRYETIPEREKFRAQYKDSDACKGLTSGTGGEYNYRFDVLKFSHKPFVLWHFMAKLNPELPKPYDYVIWLDADTLTHQAIPESVVRKLMCRNADFLYLGRSYKYSECGFMVFRLPGALPFMQRVIDYYTNGTFVYEKEWHDSWLFDEARKAMQSSPSNRVAFENLTPNLVRKRGGGHPFVNSFLGKYMDHLKGDARKATGKPRPNDMVIGHSEPYWKDHQ